MLNKIADGLWTLDRDIRLLGGIVPMPARATIVRTSGNKLLVHSPLAIDDETAEAIAGIGEVAWIVAPNCLHHLFLADAVRRWPGARVFGPARLEGKRKDISFEPLPSEGRPFGEEIDVRCIGGAPWLSEHVFFHGPSRTLIVSDLVLNVQTSDSFLLQVMLRIGFVWKKLGQSFEWRLLVKDRAAAAQSARDLFLWDFDRLVMAHGEIVETEAREKLEGALVWMQQSRAIEKVRHPNG